MIDDKKIEEAATVASISDTEKGRVREDYVINALGDHESGFREGYIEGAKWAINEFLKDLWHPVSEEPEDDKNILIEQKYDISCSNLYYGIEEYNSCYGLQWNDKVRILNITRWLYIDDLFPKK